MCSGSATLTAVQRAELLAVLAQDIDEVVHERAGSALLAQPLAALVSALEGDAPAAALFRYCGSQLIDKPEIALALARHMQCPPQVQLAAARNLPTSAVQEMFADLDRLSLHPKLAGVLLQGATLTAEQREQLLELLEEDLQRRKLTEADLEDVPSKEKRVTLLQRLSRMRVVERVQLALKGNREERMALIRDPCKVVQRAVLQSPRLSDREVETFASMAILSDDVLRLIGRSRTFVSNPIVVRNLLNNPKTPLEISLHFLPNATSQELKALVLNRNIPETLRSMATRLHRQRAMQRA